MLIWRLVLGAVFIGGIIALCWADYRADTPGLWLFPLAALLAILAGSELIAMLAANGFRPAAWTIYAGNLAVVAANWFGHVANINPAPGPFDAAVVAFVATVIAVFAVEMVRYRESGQSTVQLATAILVLVYVGWPLTFLIQLRFVGGSHTGMAALATLIIVVKMCDIGAYTVGRLIGRHKMTPRLSGGKTIEGLFGGLAFACLASWCAFRWLLPLMADTPHAAPSAYAWLIFGLVVGIAGVLGDLAESLLKRDLGCKDSSTWMPGFGGVLDVIDSLLFAAPIAYVVWRCLVIKS
jgi:phosphatidate cytidylyltransferase